VCVCVCVCVRICICICIYIDIYPYLYLYIYIYIYVYKCICGYRVNSQRVNPLVNRRFKAQWETRATAAELAIHAAEDEVRRLTPAKHTSGIPDMLGLRVNPGLSDQSDDIAFDYRYCMVYGI